MSFLKFPTKKENKLNSCKPRYFSPQAPQDFITLLSFNQLPCNNNENFLKNVFYYQTICMYKLLRSFTFTNTF